MRVPKFNVLGIFFGEQLHERFYSEHHQRPKDTSLSSLERTLKYLSENVGFNAITYMAETFQNIPLVSNYFPQIALSVGGGNPPQLPEEVPEFPEVSSEMIYHIDEPELAPMDMVQLNDWVTKHEAIGHNVVVNFCGLRRAKNDIVYAKEYLSKYTLKRTSIDLYPSYYDGTDWDFASRYLREIQPFIQGKFGAIIQAFGKPGVWRYPTIDEIVKLAWECKEAGAEELHFFLWNSAYTGPAGYDELLTGLDVLPLEYHRLISDMRG